LVWNEEREEMVKSKPFLEDGEFPPGKKKKKMAGART
jgi:hypothetical protein